MLSVCTGRGFETRLIVGANSRRGLVRRALRTLRAGTSAATPPALRSMGVEVGSVPREPACFDARGRVHTRARFGTFPASASQRGSVRSTTSRLMEVLG